MQQVGEALTPERRAQIEALLASRLAGVERGQMMPRDMTPARQAACEAAAHEAEQYARALRDPRNLMPLYVSLPIADCLDQVATLLRDVLAALREAEQGGRDVLEEAGEILMWVYENLDTLPEEEQCGACQAETPYRCKAHEMEYRMQLVLVQSGHLTERDIARGEEPPR